VLLLTTRHATHTQNTFQNYNMLNRTNLASFLARRCTAAPRVTTRLALRTRAFSAATAPPSACPRWPTSESAAACPRSLSTAAAAAAAPKLSADADTAALPALPDWWCSRESMDIVKSTAPIMAEHGYAITRTMCRLIHLF
jgi:hypothetical protein